MGRTTHSDVRTRQIVLVDADGCIWLGVINLPILISRGLATLCGCDRIMRFNLMDIWVVRNPIIITNILNNIVYNGNVIDEQFMTVF